VTAPGKSQTEPVSTACKEQTTYVMKWVKQI